MSLNFFLYYVIPLAVINILVFCFIWFFKRKYIIHYFIFLLFFLIYIVSNITQIQNPSPYNLFAHLADALAHGRTYLDFTPFYHDYAEYNGKVFIPQGPLPAFLMLPFSFLYGKNFNDIIFTIIIGALNCVFAYTMILRCNSFLKKTHFNRYFAFFITLLFGLGTVNWYVVVRGSVWHTAHIVVVFFLFLAVNEALGKRRYLLIGTLASLAILSRPSVYWVFPFFVTMAVFEYLLKKKFKEFFLQIAIYLIPYFFFAFLLGIWNYIRFDSPFNFGFDAIKHAGNLRSRLNQYGVINIHYLPENLRIAFIMLFKIVKTPPYIIPEPDGMAITYTSPFFFYFFAPLVFLIIKQFKFIKVKFASILEKIHYEFNPAIIIGSVAAILFTAIPLLLYFNTGWVQFGYRYILDYIPFMLILLAFCMRGKITKLSIILFIIAFIVNLYGMIIYIHFPDSVFV